MYSIAWLKLNLNVNHPSSVGSVCLCVCAYHCAQLYSVHVQQSAQNSTDNLSSYPSENYCSDVVFWREWVCIKLVTSAAKFGRAMATLTWPDWWSDYRAAKTRISPLLFNCGIILHVLSAKWTVIVNNKL